MSRSRSAAGSRSTLSSSSMSAPSRNEHVNVDSISCSGVMNDDAADFGWVIGPGGDAASRPGADGEMKSCCRECHDARCG